MGHNLFRFFPTCLLFITLAHIGICYFLLLLMLIQKDRLKVHRRTMAMQEIEFFTTGLPASFKSLVVCSAAFRTLLCDTEYKRRLAITSRHSSGLEDSVLLLDGALGAGRMPSEVPLPEGLSFLQEDKDFQRLLGDQNYTRWMLGENNPRLVAAIRCLFSQSC